MRHLERRFELVNGGDVSGVATIPNEPRRDCVVVLAHGAGTDMTNPLLVAVADGLAGHGFPAVRFNFPYTQRGGRAPDPAPVLEQCYRSVLAQVRADAGLRPGRLVIGGKSMGGRMASHLAAAGEAVDGLLFLGYPLHPAGKPEQLRAAHLSRIAAPLLFLAGTRDPLCRLDLLRGVLAGLPKATLHVVEDGDHSFAVRKRSGRTAAAVLDEIVAACAAWLHAAVGA
jgi:predicted alpha/beta-hydrolase family hydrolase